MIDPEKLAHDLAIVELSCALQQQEKFGEIPSQRIYGMYQDLFDKYRDYIGRGVAERS